MNVLGIEHCRQILLNDSLAHNVIHQLRSDSVRISESFISNCGSVLFSEIKCELISPCECSNDIRIILINGRDSIPNVLGKFVFDEAVE